jgi:hypothetical protein
MFLLIALLVSTVLVAAQSDPRAGTWHLNLGKSTFDPGPRPKSQTRVYEMAHDMLKSTTTSIQMDGAKSVSAYSARFDGKDYPATGSPVYDTIALARVDANTFDAILKRAGKVVQRARNVVSSDGKTMTVTVTGTDAGTGRTFTTIMVFEK